MNEVAISRLFKCMQKVLEDCRRVLDEVLSTDEQSSQIAKLQDQTVGLAQRMRSLVNENARTQMTEDEFKPEYDKLAARYEKLAERIAAIQRRRMTGSTGRSGFRCLCACWLGRRSTLSSIRRCSQRSWKK